MKLQQWRWRYGFSHYTTGRVLKFAGYAKFKIEVRDRTLARTGPHSVTSFTGNRKQHISIQPKKGSPSSGLPFKFYLVFLSFSHLSLSSSQFSERAYLGKIKLRIIPTTVATPTPVNWKVPIWR